MSPLGKSDYKSHNMRYLSGPRRTWSCRGTRHRGTFLEGQRKVEDFTWNTRETGTTRWIVRRGNVGHLAIVTRVKMGLTLALSLVLHVQVRVTFAFSLQQRAFVFVGLAVWAANRSLPGDVGAVWSAHAARLTSSVHLAPLSRTAINIVAGF